MVQRSHAFVDGAAVSGGAMELSSEDRDGVRIVKIDGDIRTEDARVLAQTLEELLEEGDLDMVLDLERVGYVTSAGLGHIASIGVVLRRRGGNLAVCNLSQDVRMVFQVTRIDKVVEVLSSVDSALEHLKRFADR
jgi:anti-anti-sigma factor